MRFAPMVLVLGALATASLAACAGPAAETDPGRAAAGIEDSAPPPAAPRGERARPGFLSWEDLSVRLVGQGATAGLRIDITTLDAEAVALAGEDVRAYFADLEKRIADAVPPPGREARPFLVAYSGFQKEVRFDPTRLQVRSEGRTFLPWYIVPVSENFDRRIVGLYETVYAVYLFDPAIDLLATLEFLYGDLSSGRRWRSVVEAIERAKTRRGG